MWNTAFLLNLSSVNVLREVYLVHVYANVKPKQKRNLKTDFLSTFEKKYDLLK